MRHPASFPSVLRFLCSLGVLLLSDFAGANTAAPSVAAPSVAGPSVAAPNVTAAKAAPSQARAPSAPGETTERQAHGLLQDLARIIDIEESLGWIADDEEFSDLYPTLLLSVCVTPEPARMVALRRIQERSLQAGDPEQLYYDRGSEVTADVEDALTLQRQAIALERVVALAPETCPFWLTPDDDFKGRQVDSDRFTLVAESGGYGQLRRTEDTWTLGGGGLLRLLMSYGFGGHVSVLFGGEFGGGGMIIPHSKPTEFVVNYFPALPLILRLRSLSWHYDLEVGAVSLLQASNTRLSYGARGGLSIGVSGLKRNGLVPWAGVTAAYDYYFESGGRAPAHFVRAGFRAGVFWDP